MKLKRIHITVFILLFACHCYPFQSDTSIGNDTIVGSWHAELDQLRKTVKNNPTIERNVKERRAALYRLWRLLRRQGMDMSSFDSFANDLIILSNDNKMVYGVIDNGFATLEHIIANPIFIKEVKGKASTQSSSTINWPVYHGVNGSQNGYSPDKGPETGEIVWKFPKTNGWNANALLLDGKVYTAGAGTDVIAYCLNQKTGDVIWKGRTNSASYYTSPGAKKTPQIVDNSLIVRTGSKLNRFNLETGKKEFSKRYYTGINNATNSESIVNIFNNVISCNDSDTGNQIWSFKPKGEVTGQPASTNNAVFVTSTKNTCYKVNKQNGAVLWEKSFNATIRGNISYADDKVLVGFKSGLLIALESESGNEVWRFKSDKEEPRAYDFFGSAIAEDGYLYIGSADKFIYCLDGKSGKKLWEFETQDWNRSRPIIVDKTIFIADLSGIGYALDISKKTPSLIWKEKISDHGFTADLVGNKQGVLFSDRNMMLTSVDPNTGKTQWLHSQLDGTWVNGKFFAAGEISGQQSSPTIVDGILYIASPDGFVNAVDTETGKELWKFETKSSCSPSPTVAEGKVFVGQTYESFGTYFALDKNTGKPIWTSQELGSVWISAAYDNGMIFLGNMNGDFFALDPNTGKKLWNYFTAKNTPDENKSLKGSHHGWPPGVYCNPITEGNVVYTGSWSGYYFAFDQLTGELLWRRKTQPEGIDGGLPDSAAPVLHKNHLYVQKAGSRIAAINKHTGKIDWEWAVKPGWLQNGTIAAMDNMIFGSAIRQVTSLPYNATIYAFNDFSNGGELLWEYKGGGGLTSPVLTKNKIIFGSSADPFLTCLNPKTGEVIWKTHVGGIMLESVPSIYGNKVFALIKNGYLYAIK